MTDSPREMRHQSPWRAYFGMMHQSASSRRGPVRHPIVVALSVISLVSLLAAAFLLRFGRWYYGKLSVLSLCEDPTYNIRRVDPVIPINRTLACCLAIAAPPIIVLVTELLLLIVTLDEDGDSEYQTAEDGTKAPHMKPSTLLAFRVHHFAAVHFLTLAFVSVIVDLAKISFNWPRPYFLREFPLNCDQGYVHDNPGRTLSPAEMRARLGFPSHRVAFLSAAALLLSIHSVRTLRALRASGPFQTLVILGSLVAPIFAAASVITSNENRPIDVVMGILVGTIVAAYTASMLPKLVPEEKQSEPLHEETSAPLPATPTTIEGLNSVMPMRPAVSWHFPRSPMMGRSLNQRHPRPVSNAGLTRQESGRLTRVS